VVDRISVVGAPPLHELPPSRPGSSVAGSSGWTGPVMKISTYERYGIRARQLTKLDHADMRHETYCSTEARSDEQISWRRLMPCLVYPNRRILFRATASANAAAPTQR
jgi:hypothetical protein